jgi:phosphoglycolate phosphatase
MHRNGERGANDEKQTTLLIQITTLNPRGHANVSGGSFLSHIGTSAAATTARPRPSITCASARRIEPRHGEREEQHRKARGKARDAPVPRRGARHPGNGNDMAYSLVIFDLDGTLVDSLSWFLPVVNGVAREYGFREIADHEIEPMRREGPREILRRLEVPLWKLPAIARHIRGLKREQIDAMSLFPGVPAMLRALHETGLALALVTSDSEDNARRQLGPDAVLFSHFACGASLFGKAAKFKSIVRRAGVAAAQAIAIGDEVRDIEAARATGVACGAVTWGYSAIETLAAMKPDLIFENINDIAAQLGPQAAN